MNKYSEPFSTQAFTAQASSMQLSSIFFVFLSFIFLATGNLFADTMHNLQPYSSLIRPPYERHLDYHLNLFTEGGIGTKSFDEHGSVSGPLQIWQPDQSSLAMLEGFDPESKMSKLRNQIPGGDDGTRGHFAVCGDLDIYYAAALSARFFFLQNWFVSIHLPAYHQELRNVSFTDKTKNNNNNDADYRTKTLLTDNFATNMLELACLDIGGWKRTGIGDLTVLLNWYHDFPQPKDILKMVSLNTRFGLSLPTGKKADINKIFALPFGNNGACALPFGLGLDLTLGSYFQAGIDVQLTHIFGHSSDYRIKTALNQTELILLQKARAYKDYGLTQQFNLYAKMNKFFKGLSVLAGYQYLKHGQDYLALCNNTFSNSIANTAESLQESTAHHIFINTSYDFAVHSWEKTRVQPYISLYAKIPFNGKRFTGSNIVGCVIAFDF